MYQKCARIRRFQPIRLASSEKHIPQVDETQRKKCFGVMAGDAASCAVAGQTTPNR